MIEHKILFIKFGTSNKNIYCISIVNETKYKVPVNYILPIYHWLTYGLGLRSEENATPLHAGLL